MKISLIINYLLVSERGTIFSGFWRTGGSLNLVDKRKGKLVELERTFCCSTECFDWATGHHGLKAEKRAASAAGSTPDPASAGYQYIRSAGSAGHPEKLCGCKYGYRGKLDWSP